MRLTLEFKYKDGYQRRPWLSWNGSIKRAVDEIFFGYDYLINPDSGIRFILIKERKKRNQSYLLQTNLTDRVSIKYIGKNGLRIRVRLDYDTLREYRIMLYYAWIKYVLNIAEMGYYVENVIIKNIHPALRKVKKINLDSTLLRGSIIKYYSSLSIDKLEGVYERVLSLGCNLIKEDETYYSKRSIYNEKKKLLNKLASHFSKRFLYVENIIPFLIENNRMSCDQALYEQAVLVPYIAIGYSYLMNPRSSCLIWGHRLGHKLLETLISKQVYLAFALAFGADFIHVGTPLNWNGFVELDKLLNNLYEIKRYVPVFTGVPSNNKEFLDELIKTSGGNIALLTPLKYLNKEFCTGDFLD